MGFISDLDRINLFLFKISLPVHECMSEYGISAITGRTQRTGFTHWIHMVEQTQIISMTIKCFDHKAAPADSEGRQAVKLKSNEPDSQIHIRIYDASNSSMLPLSLPCSELQFLCKFSVYEHHQRTQSIVVLQRMDLIPLGTTMTVECSTCKICISISSIIKMDLTFQNIPKSLLMDCCEWSRRKRHPCLLIILAGMYCYIRFEACMWECMLFHIQHWVRCCIQHPLTIFLIKDHGPPNSVFLISPRQSQRYYFALWFIM